MFAAGRFALLTTMTSRYLREGNFTHPPSRHVAAG